MCRECCIKCVPTIQQVRKGNQVWVLSDPVTVFGESVFKIPLHNPIIHVRRGGQTLVSVSQETCLVYEMSFRARLNIQQMEWMAHFILRNVGLWVIAAVFYLCEISCRMHEYMTGVYALSSIFIAYEWHISPATTMTPPGAGSWTSCLPEGLLLSAYLMHLLLPYGSQRRFQ